MTEENPFDKLLNKLTNTTEVEIFNNDSYTGLEIAFSIKGFGFGAINIAYNKKENTWSMDSEAMDQETISEIIAMAAPNIAKAMFKLHEPVDETTSEKDGE